VTTDDILSAKEQVDKPLFLSLVVGVGLLWGMVQFFENLIAVTMDENESFRCSLDQPKVAFSILTAGACIAALTGLGFGLARRTGAAYAAVAVEAVFALAWISIGGLDASGCAIGI
jgi:hypothetical protein